MGYGVDGHHISCDAAPGSGKSFILKNLAASLPSKKGLTLSFNQSTAASARKSFPSNFQVSTAHALALNSLGDKYKNKLGSLNAFNAISILDLQPSSFASAYDLGYFVLQTVTNFCNSSDRSINLTHAPKIQDVNEEMTRETKSKLVNWAGDLFNMAIDPESTVPVTHDIYMKLFQLTEPNLKSDIILLDEGQDTNPVLWDIINKQKEYGTQIVLVGDRYQQLYSYRGAMNVMDLNQGAKHVNMNTSWRFSHGIATVANTVLNRHFATDYRIQGNDVMPPSSVGGLQGAEKLCLFRTNESLMGDLFERAIEGQRVSLIGGEKQTISILNQCRDLKEGRNVAAGELKRFKSWDHFTGFTESQAGRHLRKFKKICDNHDIDLLIKILKKASETVVDANTVLMSTVHQGKGLEAVSCKLGDDFIGPNDKRYTPEESNILYVAVTRSNKLDEVNVRDKLLAYSEVYLERQQKQEHAGNDVKITLPADNAGNDDQLVQETQFDEMDISNCGPSPF